MKHFYRIFSLSLVVFACDAATTSRQIDNQIRQLESTIRSHQTMRGKMERRRMSLAEKLIREESSIASQMVRLDTTHQELNDLDGEISEITNVIYRLGQSENDLLSQLKESFIGMNNKEKKAPSSVRASTYNSARRKLTVQANNANKL